MNRQELVEKMLAEFESMKVKGRENFLVKGFSYPEDKEDGELTLAGAQMVVVCADSIGIKYTFYKINDEFLEKDKRDKLIKTLKEQYPGMIFFVCAHDNVSSRTIDTENNFMVIDNNGFDVAAELCGDVNKLLETML